MGVDWVAVIDLDGALNGLQSQVIPANRVTLTQVPDMTPCAEGSRQLGDRNLNGRPSVVPRLSGTSRRCHPTRKQTTTLSRDRSIGARSSKCRSGTLSEMCVMASVSVLGGLAGWLTLWLPLTEVAFLDFAARRAHRTGRRGLIGAWTVPRLRRAHRLVRVVPL